ncbi:glycosyltransferase family 2 protein [Alicycliphilus denitrificans]|uniref:glycosyltransferase family 2 protein n=1 Tax=Alicycliphilus denitrificans TaxID=179636 RepID=UPI0038505A64
MSCKVAVVIPCYRVKAHILGVIASLGPEVTQVYVVDDACPEDSGHVVQTHCHDARVTVLRHAENRGVGGAVKTGYLQALRDGADVVVKVDGDGQMDPRLIPHFIHPILDGQADYTKGNRFYNLEHIRRMPGLRLIGNAMLSLAAKLSSGYWNIFDVTNGYTACHAKVLQRLPLEKISNRYFFETDMLFRLNTIRAVTVDIPMDAVYGDERSNLKIDRILLEFGIKHLRNFAKRIFYNYFLRDMTVASLELVAGTVLFCFGVIFGSIHWIQSAVTGVPASTGTVMLAALPALVGLQLLLSFISFDVANVPRRAIHPDLPDSPASETAMPSAPKY